MPAKPNALATYLAKPNALAAYLTTRSISTVGSQHFASNNTYAQRWLGTHPFNLIVNSFR